MNEISRRQFLNRSKRMGAALAGGTAVSTWPRVSRATSANEKIVLAIIGVRGRGQALATGFAERKDCEVAYLADVDTSVLASRAETVGKTQGSGPKNGTGLSPRAG